jgi:hypothetical protein
LEDGKLTVYLSDSEILEVTLEYNGNINIEKSSFDNGS